MIVGSDVPSCPRPTTFGEFRLSQKTITCEMSGAGPVKANCGLSHHNQTKFAFVYRVSIKCEYEPQRFRLQPHDRVQIHADAIEYLGMVNAAGLRDSPPCP